MKRYALIILLSLQISANIYAEQRTYLETTGDRLVLHEFTLSDHDNNGTIIEEVATLGDDEIIRWYQELDSTGSTVIWREWYSEDAIDAHAVRDSNGVSLSGLKEGAPFEKTFVVGEEPWYQDIPFGLEDFVLSGEESRIFWGIHPKMHSSSTFRAARKGVEEIKVGGEMVDGLRVRVRMTGMLSRVWHADYWFDPIEGTWLRYEGKQGPTAPLSIIELTGWEE